MAKNPVDFKLIANNIVIKGFLVNLTNHFWNYFE